MGPPATLRAHPRVSADLGTAARLEDRTRPVDFEPIFTAIGDFIANPIIQLGLRAAAIYIIVLWLASAFWAFRDLQLRTANPVVPYLAAAMIILFTPFFFLLGVVVYRIVRPGERIGEVNERQLAEEALLAEVEAVKACPTCRRRVHDEWIICPTCRTRLNRVCPNCGKLVGLDWSLCAWCGRDFERREAAFEALPSASAPTTLPAPTPVRPDRASARATSGPRPATRTTSPRSGAQPAGPRPDALAEH
jgi:RNA polymerase subunit RPABC4/transcription elongation factor Spt4